MSEIKQYRKIVLQPMRPYVVGEDLSEVSVRALDILELGGMIATNPEDSYDKWYVNKEYFESNYEEVS